MSEMAASIAHEINQPLAAMVANGSAGLRWLASAAPDLDEARAALTRSVKDGQRANQIIGGIRSMFKKDIHGRAQLSVNDLVREVATMIEVDLRTQRVSISLDLREGLPQLIADRGQLPVAQWLVNSLLTVSRHARLAYDVSSADLGSLSFRQMSGPRFLCHRGLERRKRA